MSLCILTALNYQWVTVFDEILRIIHATVFSSAQPASEANLKKWFEMGVEFLRNIMKQGIPSPGTSLQIVIPSRKSGQLEFHLSIPQTSSSLYPDVSWISNSNSRLTEIHQIDLEFRRSIILR